MARGAEEEPWALNTKDQKPGPLQTDGELHVSGWWSEKFNTKLQAAGSAG